MSRERVSRASAELGTAALDTLAQSILLEDAAGRVVAEWGARGIPAVALKGLALLRTVYRRDPGSRPMADADLLVPPERREEAEAALVALGFARVPGQISAFVPRSGTPPLRIDLEDEIWYLGPRGTRELFARARLASPASPARRGAGAAGEIAIAIPTLEDALLHGAIHAVVMHGQLRPVWLEDLRRLALLGPDWALVAGRARAAGLTAPLGIALERAARSGAPVPAEILAALRPRGTDRLRAALLARVLARPETAGTGHLLRFLFRRGARAKLRALARQLFPGREFLARRYGARSRGEALLRGALRPAQSAARGCELLARHCLGRGRAGAGGRP